MITFAHVIAFGYFLSILGLLFMAMGLSGMKNSNPKNRGIKDRRSIHTEFDRQSRYRDNKFGFQLGMILFLIGCPNLLMHWTGILPEVGQKYYVVTLIYNAFLILMIFVAIRSYVKK